MSYIQCIRMFDFFKVEQPLKDFAVSILWHILSIKGKIYFLQFGCFGSIGEQTYRAQFERKFVFLNSISN